MVKQYELMVLLPSNFNQEQIKSAVQGIEKLVTNKKGSIHSQESLGKRQLAYPIRKQADAYYLVFTLSLDASVVQSLERDVRLTDDVLRSLLIIKETKKLRKRKSATIKADEGVQE